MLHRLVLSTFSFLVLMTCQSQKNETVKNETSANNTVVTINSEVKPKTPVQATPPKKTGEPEMAPGLPPDKAAVDQAKKEAEEANKQGVVYLSEGENKFLKEYQMNVTFKRMLEDSRCPKGVNCIWEGVAAAEVEFMGTATRPRTLILSTVGVSNKGYEKTQFFNGYHISLVKVEPQTTEKKDFKVLEGSYKIGLKLSKGSPGTTTK